MKPWDAHRTQGHVSIFIKDPIRHIADQHNRYTVSTPLERSDLLPLTHLDVVEGLG